MSIAEKAKQPPLPPYDPTYPDSDGKPLAENTIQYRYITLIKGGLDVVFHDRTDVFVAGDLFWYPVEGKPEICTAPDVLVALGRPKGDRRSYMQWREAYQPPQVVFEVLSPGNRVAEMVERFLFYQRYGVQEYYLYDPDKGELSGWQREKAELRPILTMDGWVSPLLGVGFALEGTELRLFGPDGGPFVTYEQMVEQLHRAEEQLNRVEEQRDCAVERAERLARRLRELGVTAEE